MLLTPSMLVPLSLFALVLFYLFSAPAGMWAKADMQAGSDAATGPSSDDNWASLAWFYSPGDA